MSESNSSNRKLYQKWWFWVAIVLGLLIIGSFASENQSSNTSVTPSENIVQENEEKEAWSIAMKKCMVMEGADIYTTGIGKKSDNVFDDAKDTCNSWYNDWGDDKFYSIVDEDWDNRKDEQIDNKPLTYYLEIVNF